MDNSIRDEILRQMARRLEADMLAAFGVPKNQPKTALRVRGRTFETVELDDKGNIIKPCRKCGPILLCPEHMALVG